MSQNASPKSELKFKLYSNSIFKTNTLFSKHCKYDTQKSKSVKNVYLSSYVRFLIFESLGGDFLRCRNLVLHNASPPLNSSDLQTITNPKQIKILAENHTNIAKDTCSFSPGHNLYLRHQCTSSNSKYHTTSSLKTISHQYTFLYLQYIYFHQTLELSEN